MLQTRPNTAATRASQIAIPQKTTKPHTNNNNIFAPQQRPSLYALPYLAPPQMGAPQTGVPYRIFSIKGLNETFAMALSAPFLNLPTAIKFSYEAILRAGLNNKLPSPIAGLSTPAKGDDPVVKLLAKRVQADHVAMMLAINVAYETEGLNGEKNFEKFAIIVRSFGIMLQGDSKSFILSVFRSCFDQNYEGELTVVQSSGSSARSTGTQCSPTKARTS